MNKDPINNGGPAFPNVPSDLQYQSWDESMSLRDWFAGQALSNLAVTYMVGYRNRTQAAGRGWHQRDAAFALAKECYLVADAMIAARNQAAK